MMALAAPTIQAQTSVTFQWSAENGVKTAAVEATSQNDAAYVSLTQLMRAFGGSCDITPSRVEVGMGGRLAFIRIGSNMVDASTSQFSLARRILRVNDEILLAQDDVALFFGKALEATVSMGEATQPETETGEAASLAPLESPAPPSEPLPVESAPPAPDSALPATETAVQPTMKAIIIDAGHGGNDTGAIGSNGLQEKTAALSIAKELQALLQAEPNTKALLTRNEDIELPNAARANFAQVNKGALFISVHSCASYSRTARGFDIFYSDAEKGAAAQSRPLAEAIAQALSEATQMESRGVFEGPCRVLKSAAMPGVLVEAGCIANEEDESQLGREAFRRDIARGIANGVKAYFAAQGSVTP